jgi:plastocyanin
LVGLVALAAGGVLPAVAVSETTPTIEAVNGLGYYGTYHEWKPAQATVAASGAVTFSNPTEVAHGVEWRSAIKPSCEEGPGKVPVGTTPAASGTKWSGECTFSQPGAYTFYCTVHGPEMTGTITVPGTASATTDEVTEATPTMATLNGTIKPEGNTTEYHFEYGTTTLSEHVTSTVTLSSADFSSHQVSAALTALIPSTKYHAELVANYGAGKTMVLGGEETFTTATTVSPQPPPSSPPPTATTSTTTTSESVTTAPATPTATALLPALPGPPLLGGPSLRADQHGSTVRGSLDISPTGAGGRLEVDLLANAASLSKTGRSGAVRVGRLVRVAVSAGRFSFSVHLTRGAQHALIRHHHLALSVKIALTPPNGIAVTLTRTVVVHA